MKLVVIDAGHGGKDPGAVGDYSAESEIVLKVAKKVEAIIDSVLAVKLTRVDDTYLSLSERPNLSNEWGADAFVSIHCNSASNRTATGWEIFTTRGQNNSDKLASCIAESAKRLPIVARTDYGDGDPDKEADFTVIEGTYCPSALFEMGFISNPEEENLLNEDGYQNLVAEVIADGVLKYLGEELPCSCHCHV